MNQPNIAAIGAGAWGKNIVRTLHGMGALAAVAESMEVRQQELAAQYPGVRMVGNYGELFTDSSIQAVTIATPAPSHHRVAKDCMLAGKDVFVEKPLTLTAAEAEDLVSTAEKLGRILMVGHLLLYKPAMEAIREVIASGRLGKIFTLHQERMKLGRARAVENALWSLGVHDVAALLFIVGSAPVEVTFSGHRGLQPGIEDDTYLHLRFADGIVAHLHNSWLWPEDRRGLTVVGELGMLCYDEKSETVTLVHKRIDDHLHNSDGGTEVLFREDSGHQALRAELAHFLHCVQTRETPRSCGRNGLEVIRVLERAGTL